MRKDEILENTYALFLRNRGRKEAIEFLNSQGIEGEEAEEMATQAYKLAKQDIDQVIEIEEHQALGGPIGKIGVGLFALGIGVFGVIALERIFFIVFIIGFALIGTGIFGFFRNPAKNI